MYQTKTKGGAHDTPNIMNTIDHKKLNKLSTLNTLLGMAHDIITMYSKLSTDTSVERRTFFAIDKAIDTTLEAIEDELTILDEEGKLTSGEYTFYNGVVDKLRKL